MKQAATSSGLSNEDKDSEHSADDFDDFGGGSFFPCDELESNDAERLYNGEFGAERFLEGDGLTFSDEVHVLVALGEVELQGRWLSEYEQIRAAFLDAPKKAALSAALKKKMQHGMFHDVFEVKKYAAQIFADGLPDTRCDIDS